MRSFLEARNKCKDAMAIAAAEKQIILFRRRLILPRLLSSCSSSSSSDNDGTSSSRHHLPIQEISSVALSLRHTTYVMWLLSKLLLDGFDREQLEQVLSFR
jgi:hypothetical protein